MSRSSQQLEFRQSLLDKKQSDEKQNSATSTLTEEMSLVPADGQPYILMGEVKTHPNKQASDFPETKIIIEESSPINSTAAASDNKLMNPTTASGFNMKIREIKKERDKINAQASELMLLSSQINAQISELTQAKQQVTIQIDELKRQQKIKTKSIKALEKKRDESTATILELKRLRQQQRDLTEAISIIRIGLIKQKVPSVSVRLSLFFLILGTGLAMLLSNRRFNHLKTELFQTSYTFDCPFPWHGGGGSCDSRVDLDNAYHSTRADDLGCHDNGYGCDYPYADPINIVDPCSSLIKDLCSFRSGVINDQLTYFIVMGLGVEGILVILLAFEFFSNCMSSPVTSNTCRQISETSHNRLQDIAEKYNININNNTRFVTQDDLTLFQNELLAVNQAIDRIMYKENCRSQVFMAAANHDIKVTPINLMFSDPHLREPKIFRDIFEFADVAKPNTLVKEDEEILHIRNSFFFAGRPINLSAEKDAKVPAISSFFDRLANEKWKVKEYNDNDGKPYNLPKNYKKIEDKKNKIPAYSAQLVMRNILEFADLIPVCKRK